MSDTSEYVPNEYECCIGIIVIILFIIGMGSLAWGGSNEVMLLRVIGLILSLGFIAVIVILYRIEKALSKPLQERTRPKSAQEE